ncbi:MAG: hypothetical protein OEL83_03335 [Desulforhopalus sp.]|nr:hypothetical protein [Desulforhopalus sp.]
MDDIMPSTILKHYKLREPALSGDGLVEGGTQLFVIGTTADN